MNQNEGDRQELSLADLIQKHRDMTGDSYMTIARASGLSKARVGQLATAEQRHMPRAETLEKLARGLRLPLHVVQEAAMVSAGTRPPDGKDQRVNILISRLNELPPDDLDTVAAVVESIIARRRG